MKDIYLAHEKNLEKFVQVGYDALDTGDGGISGEPNPVRHREVAKKLAPAFSAKNFREKELTIHQHLNFFIERMKEVGNEEKSADLRKWTDWLALDLSADMTYGRDTAQMREMKDSVFLSSCLKLNLFLTMSQVTRKFRSSILSILPYLTIPPSIWTEMPFLINMNSQIVQDRIQRRGKTDHLDYFEQLIPSDSPAPVDKKHIYHLENVAGQLLLASWQPLANQFYSLVFFLLREPDLKAYRILVEEVRSTFRTYEDIITETSNGNSCRYLQACVSESLRLHQETVDGLPRISPGAIVEGEYIPQGVH